MKSKIPEYQSLKMMTIRKNSVYFFLLCIFFASCSNNKEKERVVHAMDVFSVKFIKPEDDSITPRNFATSCILDGTFYDQCPLNDIDDGGFSPGGGNGPNPNTPPDFNPLSGSITIPNPAVVGQ